MYTIKYHHLIVAGCIWMASCSENRASDNKTKPPAASAYQLVTVEAGGVATSVKLPGQLAAYQEVSIFPKVNGYVKQVYVDIGSEVPAGKLLMLLEAPELQQASMQAREKYLRARADFSIDKERYNRLLEAAQTPGAVSPLDLSAIRAKMEADSALCNGERTNWEMQQTMQGYLKVTAPFAGVITDRNVHPGALVSASVKDKPMLELKQVAHLRLQVSIPEEIASGLKVNDSITFYVSALQGKKMAGTITRKSSDINVQYRSERMEIDVKNKDGLLAPGMYADIILQSKGNRNALYVPKSAIVTSTERKYVLQVSNGKTIKVDVSTGNNTPDKTEVYGALQAGDKVIANANDEIEEGIKL